MSRKLRRVQSFMPDGTVLLEDGSVMQAVVSDTGALGVRVKTQDDRISALDQYVGVPGLEPVAMMSPAQVIASAGLDQVA